jgi:hypothetical protein
MTVREILAGKTRMWAAQIPTALAFLAVGGAKLAGVPMAASVTCAVFARPVSIGGNPGPAVILLILSATIAFQRLETPWGSVSGSLSFDRLERS